MVEPVGYRTASKQFNTSNTYADKKTSPAILLLCLPNKRHFALRYHERLLSKGRKKDFFLNFFAQQGKCQMCCIVPQWYISDDVVYYLCGRNPEHTGNSNKRFTIIEAIILIHLSQLKFSTALWLGALYPNLSHLKMRLCNDPCVSSKGSSGSSIQSLSGFLSVCLQGPRS